LPDDETLVDKDSGEEILFSVSVKSASLISFCAALIISLGVFLKIWMTVPRFQQMFIEFNTQLPAVTYFILSSVFRYSLLLLMAAAVVKEFTLKNKKICFVLNLVLLGIALAALALLVIGLYAPLLKIMSEINHD